PRCCHRVRRIHGNTDAPGLVDRVCGNDDDCQGGDQRESGHEALEAVNPASLRLQPPRGFYSPIVRKRSTEEKKCRGCSQKGMCPESGITSSRAFGSSATSDSATAIGIGS